jgi:choice-of-anchor A domain-containing protein
MKKRLTSMILSLFLMAALVCQIGTSAPVADDNGYWDLFNVYSLGNIGVSENMYTSDFQGVGGAAGSVFFNNFELNLLGPAAPYSLYTGGSATLTNGTYHAGLNVAGTATLSAVTVFGGTESGALSVQDSTILGDVSTARGGSFVRGYIDGEVRNAGSMTINQATVNGDIENTGHLAISHATAKQDVSNSGTINISDATVEGALYSNGGYTVTDAVILGGINPLTSPLTPYAFSSGVDHTAVSAFFEDTSALLASMSDTVGTTVTVDMFDPDTGLSRIVITAVDGVNVVNLDSATFVNSWQVIVNGSDNATVYINILQDTPGALNYGDADWLLQGGVMRSNVVVNFPDATGLNIYGSHFSSILAPHADVTFTNGLLTGTLVAGNLFGDGQVNVGEDYVPPTSAPEPATLFLVLTAGAGLAVARRRKRKIAA